MEKPMEARRPKNRPNEEGDDSEPRLASRRDCVLTASRERNKRYPQFSMGGMSPQRRAGAKTPVCEGKGTQGPWRRGATGCCRLLRQLLVRCGWTVASVSLVVSFVELLDKPVEDISIRSFGSASIQWTDGRCHSTSAFL